MDDHTRRAFTLIELLVVVVVIAILMGILLPVLSRVRTHARVVHAHNDLIELGRALHLYHEDYRRYPPARTFCASQMDSIDDYNHLPPELVTGGYLPELPKDVFNRGHTYKYIRPGVGWANGDLSILAIWVPTKFPGDDGSNWPYFSEDTSPVKYALWSVGPAGAKSVFESDSLCYPVPSRHWYPKKRDGIIVHLMSELGLRSSP
jgi:type II secretion system protein G